jgi:hypothetical protein
MCFLHEDEKMKRCLFCVRMFQPCKYQASLVEMTFMWPLAEPHYLFNFSLRVYGSEVTADLYEGRVGIIF